MNIKSTLLALSATALLATGVAHANELIVNGGFEGGNVGQLGINASVPGWFTDGYNFLYNATGADSPGATGLWGNVSLWGPANGSNNGLTASPNGGSFVANDGGSGVAPISQQVNGLVAGQQYTLSFYWGGAQQYGYNGPTTEQWIVSLGNDTKSTAILNNAEHGFTGWQKETMTFTAGGSSELLSFLAVGTPAGVPPFSLLDGVTMAAAVPEPDTWAMMALGMGLLGCVARRRKAKAAQAA
ncbi:PEPxxWA-CTERM sorting domain-containing protein [Duganella sp. PWIR1]